MARFVKFPGTAGSYASTDDVNLLDADTSHVVQSQPWSATRTSIGATTFDPDGFGILNCTITDQASNQRIQRAPIAVPLTTQAYSIGFTFRHTAAAARDVRLYRVDGDGETHSGSTFYALAPNVTHFLAWSWTPVLAGDLTDIRLETRASGNAWLNGDEYTATHMTIRTGTDATFVPSLRIVGDLDTRARLSLADWTTPLPNQWISAFWSPGWQWAIDADGTILTRSNRIGGGTDNRSSTVPTGLADGAVADLRWIREVNVSIRLYVDGVQLGTDLATTAGLDSGASELFVGSTSSTVVMTGDLYSAEVRDGIDGPVVAVFDPDDIIL